MSDTPPFPVEPTKPNVSLVPTENSLPLSREATLLQNLQEQKETFSPKNTENTAALPRSILVVNILFFVAILAGCYWFFQKIQGITKLPVWIEDYYQGNPAVRKKAISKIIRLDSNHAAFVLLMASTEEEFSDIRILANWGLARLDWTSQDCLPPLLKAAQNNLEFVRLHAHQALSKLPQKSPEMIPILLNALSDRVASIRTIAVQTLRYFKEQSKTLSPQITTFLLQEPDSFARQSASWTLVELHPTEKELASSFLICLLDKEETTRRYLISAINHLQCTPEEQLQAFTTALHFPDKANLFWNKQDLLEIHFLPHRLVQIFQEVLQNLDPALHKRSLKTLEDLLPITEPLPPGFAQILVPFLFSSDEEIYSITLSILRKLEKEAASTLPHIIASFENRHKFLREEGIHTLSKIGPGSREEISLLTPLLQHSSLDIRKQAILALGNIPSNESIAPLLQQLSQESSEFVLLEILRALRKRGNITLISKITPYLTHSHFHIRLEVVSMLEQFDPQGEQILPFLAPMLKDRDFEIRDKTCTFLIQTQKKEAAAILLEAIRRSEESMCLDILAFFEKIHYIEAIPTLQTLGEKHRSPRVLSMTAKVLKSLQNQ